MEVLVAISATHEAAAAALRRFSLTGHFWCTPASGVPSLLISANVRPKSAPWAHGPGRRRGVEDIAIREIPPVKAPAASRTGKQLRICVGSL